jgi:hypothetical protein
MSFYRALVAAAVVLASGVNAHISMTNPTPYGHPDTSPLNPSGSNYPCKTDNGFSINNVTTLTPKSNTLLAFAGTAVHNGGSCQLSLTPGYQPDTNSPFKVIYTIEGGCPGTNGQTTTYNFNIPSFIPTGNYSLAWTWYNNIGNREIYMNCAPVTVSGTQGDQAQYNALPDMAIFNIPSKNACGTIETFDVAFPDPGKFVTTGAGYKPTPPSNCGVKAAVSGSAGGNSSGGSSVGGSSPSSQALTQSPTATSTLIYTQTSTIVAGSSATGGIFGEQPGSSANGNYTDSATTSVAAAAPAALSTSILASAAPAASGSAQMPAGISSVQSCSSDGALQCSPDGTLQGLCNFGQALMMPVAPGTKCVNGQIMKRSPKFVGI